MGTRSSEGLPASVTALVPSFLVTKNVITAQKVPLL
jgi:hypothetical protein